MEEEKKQFVINLIGGPGSGKSTTMAGIFYSLKKLGVNCEMTPEYVKDKVYEESFRVMDDQIYVFGKQLHKLWRLCGKVDIIITDGSLLNSIVYDKSKSKPFRELVLEQFSHFDNLNVFIGRQQEYVMDGRIESEEVAKAYDQMYRDLLEEEKIPYIEFPNIDACGQILKLLVKMGKVK